MTLDELAAAEAALREIAPHVVLRYRCAGVLTWALVHRLEAEVLDELHDTGRYPPHVVGMLRAAQAMRYPNDDSPVALNGHGAVPIVVSVIVELWNRVH